MKTSQFPLKSIDKHEIYTSCRSIIFAQMENNTITPERADEILGYVKVHVIEIESPEQSQIFYTYIAHKFPELKYLERKFEAQINEGFDRLISIVIDEMMEDGKLQLAQEILEGSQKGNNETIIDKLKKQYPFYFSKALQKQSMESA